MPGFPVLHHLLQLAQTHESIEPVMPSNHLILCLSLLVLPSICFSIMVFSNESSLLISQPKYWSFSFGISLSNKYSGLISLRVDWLNLLAVQGTLKSFFPKSQFKNINSLAFSLLYGSNLTSIHKNSWENHSFGSKDFCSQSNFSFFNILSRFVIAFLPRNKFILISCTQDLCV